VTVLYRPLQLGAIEVRQAIVPTIGQSTRAIAVVILVELDPFFARSIKLAGMTGGTKMGIRVGNFRPLALAPASISADQAPVTHFCVQVRLELVVSVVGHLGEVKPFVELLVCREITIHIHKHVVRLK